MNVLWREMESISPLYLVLPALRKEEEDDSDEEEDDSDEEEDDSDKEEDDSDEEDQIEYTLTEPLNGNDIQRMVFYARRIRSLHFHYEEYYNIHLELSMAFLAAINQLDAFLSLRELTVDSDLVKFQYTALQTISPSNLEDLSLVQASLSPQEEGMVNSFLKALAHKCHYLKTLTIEGDHTGVTFGVLAKFSQVQNLTIYFQDLTVISSSLVEQIASSMISLQSLEMSLDPYGSSQIKDSLKNSSRHFQFISLTNLVVHGHPRSVEKILEVVHAPLLCHLSLTLEIPGPGFDTCTSIQCTIPVKMINKIQSFSVLSSLPDPRWQGPGPIDFGSQIGPFITFEQLETFYVRVQTLRISTRHLAMFLENNQYLSNLQQLSLQYGRTTEFNESLSIAALPLIRNTCPKLSHLTISIYHPDQSAMQITTQSGKPHNLRELRFASLPDWDDSMLFTIALSSFLDHLFPGLTDVDYSDRKVPESRKKWWNGVQDMMKAHQTWRVRSKSD